LITRIIFGDDYRSLSSLLCSPLHFPVASSLLGPNTLLSTLFSSTLSVLPQCERPSFTTIQNNRVRVQPHLFLTSNVFTVSCDVLYRCSVARFGLLAAMLVDTQLEIWRPVYPVLKNTTAYSSNREGMVDLSSHRHVRLRAVIVTIYTKSRNGNYI
jgi:hypothetical protein